MNKLPLLLGLVLCLALPAPPREPVVFVKPVTLEYTNEGWLITQLLPGSGESKLQKNDLVTDVDGRRAASISPLSFINLFDEAFSRPVLATVRRGKQVLSIPLRHADPDRGPLKSSLTASNSFRAPDFAVNDLSGKHISLSALHGKWILLAFSGTWCGPCMAEVPTLKHLSEQYKDRLALVMLAVNDKDEALRSFVSRQNVQYSVVNLGDMYSPMAIEYGVSSPKGDAEIPVSILIRPDRSIAYVQVGAADSSMIYGRVQEYLTAN